MDVSFWFTFGLGVILLVGSLTGGLYLWWPYRSEAGGRHALGQSLMTGAFLAVIGLLIQLRMQHDEQQRTKIAAQQEIQRQAASQRETFRLTVGLANDLTRADLSGRDLQGAYLTGKRMPFAVFKDANLTAANLANADLADAKFTDTLLNRAVLICATIDRAAFINAKLPNAQLSSARARDVDFIGADLSHTHFNKTDLRGATFLGSKLHRADLSQADLRGADFSAAVLDGTTKLANVATTRDTLWPEGFDAPPPRKPTARDCG